MLDTLKWMGTLHGTLDFQAVVTYPNNTPHKLAETVCDAARAVFRIERHTYPCPANAGWPRGPNLAWQTTARHMKSSWLWLEGDAIPLKSDWLAQLASTYVRHRKPFMGAVVPHMGHCNGVAIYPQDTAQRCPKAMTATTLAWDYVMREEMIQDCHDASNLIFHVWSLVKGQPHPHQEGAPVHFASWKDVQCWIPRDAVLAHRVKDGSLTALLRKNHSTAEKPHAHATG